VVTVEYLNRADGGLERVQQAMVDNHGSQCGFCTPGIVASLHALWLAEPNPSAADIERQLQGNLCRCTGYEPIVKAAIAAGRNHGPDLPTTGWWRPMTQPPRPCGNGRRARVDHRAKRGISFVPASR
jgi:xanthine dehydrogenase small subunit